MESKTLEIRGKKISFSISSYRLHLFFHTNPMGGTVLDARKSEVYTIHVIPWSLSWNLQPNGKAGLKKGYN